jgi:uncharacterized damage-inducible protein DinB
MTTLASNKPAESEYAPYYGKYISLVSSGDITRSLETQLNDTLALLAGIDEATAVYRYAEGKWSIKELVGHIIDAERIFAYRALWFARNDKTPLPGFEQDDFMRFASFEQYPLTELAEEFKTVRQSTIQLFKHISPEAWDRAGVASDNPMSVRAVAWAIAGHELHHREILRSRYLNR